MKKQSAIALAVGSALAGLAGSAHALLPSDFSGVTKIYISGATAQDRGLNAAFARLCQPGSLDVYTSGTSVTSADRILTCSVVASLFPGISTTKVALHKSGLGGSGGGVTPLVDSTTVAFLNLGSLTLVNCSSLVVVNSVSPGLVPAYNHRICPTSASLINDAQIPDMGISDIEPRMFTDNDTSALTPVTPAALVFGIAVTEKLYRDLQKVQGITIHSDTSLAPASLIPTTTDLSVVQTRDLEQYMPSLSKETIGGLFAGAIDWTSVRGSGGTITPPGTNQDVFVARRVPSSGSQKSTELFLYGGVNPTDGSHSVKCQPTAIAMQSGILVNNTASEASVCGFVNAASVTVPGTVAEGNGSGNVTNCLNAHNTNNRYAIGLISLESSYGSTNGYRFIKVDGVTPSLINAWNGSYKNVVEVSAQARPGVGGDAGIAFTTLFGAAGIGAPEVSRALNEVFRHQWGNGATMSLAFNGAPAIPTGTAAVTQATVRGQPVWHYSKSSGVSGTDNCRPGFVVAPTQ